ncbi:F-box domain protein [Cooperia oncophora]
MRPMCNLPPSDYFCASVIHNAFIIHKFKAKEVMELSMWKPKKKHFRETDEWRRKKSRIISKMRALSRINLLLVLSKMQTIDKLPDKVLQQIFSYLTPYQILQSGQVCKRWRSVACSPLLWKFVSFRPNYGGLQVLNHDYFLQLIGTQFSELRIVELTTDLITPNVLYEMANKCPRLQHLTLDFSTAMQLHDFTDLQSFPSRLRSLTLCLSENIFLEGFLRKVYTFISSVELLHIIGEYKVYHDFQDLGILVGLPG